MDDFIRKQLKSLRKTLREKPRAKAPVRVAEPAMDDRALFRESVKGVKPLRNDHYPHPHYPRSPWPQVNPLSEARTMADAMTDLWPWDELESGEELLFMRPGVQHESLRKLRRGEWPVQQELDLHGHTSEEARLMVAQFLIDCRKRNLRCVRIIHGKGLGSRNGEPVLKLKLKNWLVQRGEVLAFCQARPADGGGGAALVLLKSNH